MMRINSVVWLYAGVLTLVVPMTEVVAAGPAPRPIALTGTDSALGPGLGPGVFFASFGSVDEPSATPAMNRAGESIFLAALVGPGVDATNNQGIWVERGGQLIMLARTGDPAPGTEPQVVFASFYRQPVLSASGKAAFQAVITGPGVTNDNNDGFWTEGTGTLSLLIRENTTPVPGGGLFGNPQFPGDPLPRMWAGLPVINAAGHVVQRVIITTAPNTFGLYTDQSGTLQEIVRLGDPVPGLDPPRTFVNVGTPGFSDDGFVMFRAQTSTPFPQFSGVWTDRSGSLAPIAMSGDAAPGTAAQFTDFSLNQSINGSDRVAFEALLTGGDGFDEGIWSEGSFGVVQPIAMTGAPAPGTTSTFFSFGFQFDHPVVSDSGTTAFTATVNLLELNRGVWSNRPGFLDLVAGSGNPVPGVPGLSFLDFFALGINATGEVSFFATTSAGKAICRQAPDGILEVIASTFTTLDVFGDGTDMRLITDVVLPTVQFVGDPTASGTGGGRRIAFNDDGDMLFRLAFSDSTEGVFSTSALSVPGDFDADGDVDIDDFTQFELCFTGPGVPFAPGCEPGDFDLDSDIDCNDWTQFKVEWTGPPATPPEFGPCVLDIPAASPWGVAIMAMLTCAAGTMIFRRAGACRS